jgi:hypothetical protein
VTVVGGKKIKTPNGGRKKIEFLFGWEKKTLLKKMLVALACAFF